jgi:hypothetical protein
MSLYQALVNLSVPRVGDPGKETDLVETGETVELTDDQAALFLPPKRAEALIRPAKESGQPLPRLHPRLLSAVAINPRTGKRIGMPGPPEGARPDPAGSSSVQVMIPEANEPQIDSENAGDGDAVDIPPSGRRRAAAARTG